MLASLLQILVYMEVKKIEQKSNQATNQTMEEFIVNLTGGALDHLNYMWIIVFMAIESKSLLQKVYSVLFFLSDLYPWEYLSAWASIFALLQ